MPAASTRNPQLELSLMTEAPDSADRADATRPAGSVAAAWVAGGIVAAGIGWLLHRLLFEGRAFSFDAMLYSRSLWGLANGDFDNPVIGLNTFAIHGHFLLGLLAPLAWLMPAALALALAQAASAGATAGLAAAAFGRAARGDGPAWAWGLWGAALVVLGAPLVLNPFLYDVRPDLWGVPLVTAGLLRAVERGGFDREAIGWMAPAALVREEFAIVIAAGLVVSPRGGEGSLPRRTLLLTAGVLGGWFVAYWFGIRAWLGGSEQSAAAHLTGSMGARPGDGLDLTAWLGWKGLLVGILLASGGGLALRGWRWAGSCLPGLAILLASRWMLEEQLNLHYSMFVAPGLIAATVAGWRAVADQPRRRLWAGVATAVAAGCFVVGSAAPGGGRFVAEHFDLRSEDSGEIGLNPARRTAAVALTHAALARLPKEAGVAVPHEYGAPLADRAFVTTPQRLRAAMKAEGRAPDAAGAVALEQRAWADQGSFLVQHQGFALTDRVGSLAVLERGARVRLSAVALEAAPVSCAGVVAGRWPGAGLTLCGAASAGSGRVALTVLRHAAPSAGGPSGLKIMLRPEGAEWEEAREARLMGGVVPIDALREGVVVTLVAEGGGLGVRPGGEAVLVDREGQAVAQEGGEGPIPVRWGP